MKSKPIYFSMLLVVLLCTFDSYAYEVHQGNSTVTPGCEGGVSHCVIESTFLTSLSDLKALYPEGKEFPISKEFVDFLASVSGTKSTAGAFVNPADGYANSNIMLNSSHNFCIHNDSNKTCAFKVELKLSAHDYSSNVEVSYYYLKPKESTYSSLGLYFLKYYPEQGSYKISASTIVSVDSWSSSSAEDTSYVTVK
jgi:hypothetical protein